jgi:hypothetical protein
MDINTLNKKLVIPLENDRHIKLKFDKVDNFWTCCASDEAMADIEEFFKTGYYKLDTKKQITLETNNE